MDNSNSSNRGCLLAALIVAGVLVVGGLVAATALFQFKRTRDYDEAQMVHATNEAAMLRESVQGPDGPVVMVEQSTIGNYSPTDLGEALEAKHYVAIACAPNLTSLAKQKFIEAAEEMPIEWLVRVDNIREAPTGDGKIDGQFSMPYEIRESHSSFGSSIGISATFPAQKSNELIMLRSGEYVRIRGRLNMLNNSTDSVMIIAPEIVIGNEQAR